MQTLTLSGAHAPNGPLTDVDIYSMLVGGFQSVKLLTYHHNSGDVERLKSVGIRHITARLPDTVWNKDGRRFVPSPEDYAEAAIYGNPSVGSVPGAMDLYTAGIREFVYDNEPNRYPTQWPSIENSGNRTGRMEPKDYAWFTRRVMKMLRDELPEAEIGFPGLSYASEDSPDYWLRELAGLISEFPVVWVHSYWQSIRDDGPEGLNLSPMFWQNFGANVLHYRHLFPGVRLRIGEYGNSLTDLRGTARAVPQPVIWEAMRRQYPKWLRWVRSLGYVEAAYLFIIGGQGWSGFNPSPLVLSTPNLA
jgi:hypothetical protein